MSFGNFSQNPRIIGTYKEGQGTLKVFLNNNAARKRTINNRFRLRREQIDCKTRPWEFDVDDRAFMASWALSCIYAVSIFAIGMIGAISPIALRHSRSKNRDKFLSLGSLFGAGVFLSAGFVHLLGDAAADLDNEYPWAMLVASSSLILTMFIDKAVISLVKDRQALHGRQSVEQSSSATLASSRAVVGSSLFCSSPSGAEIIDSSIGLVGIDLVSA